MPSDILPGVARRAHPACGSPDAHCARLPTCPSCGCRVLPTSSSADRRRAPRSGTGELGSCISTLVSSTKSLRNSASAVALLRRLLVRARARAAAERSRRDRRLGALARGRSTASVAGFGRAAGTGCSRAAVCFDFRPRVGTVPGAGGGTAASACGSAESGSALRSRSSAACARHWRRALGRRRSRRAP